MCASSWLRLASGRRSWGRRSTGSTLVHNNYMLSGWCAVNNACTFLLCRRKAKDSQKVSQEKPALLPDAFSALSSLLPSVTATTSSPKPPPGTTGTASNSSVKPPAGTLFSGPHKPVMLVMMVGSLSYLEIAALRCMLSAEGVFGEGPCPYRVVLACTDVASSGQVIESLIT